MRIRYISFLGNDGKMIKGQLSARLVIYLMRECARLQIKLKCSKASAPLAGEKKTGVANF